LPGTVVVDEPSAGIRRLTFSNPGKRGALDHPILDGIADAVRTAAAEPQIRALILTGADGSFSSGYDIGDIEASAFALEAERLVAHPYTSALIALDESPLPTVAALSGHTIGGGLELALACDFRVAAPDIRLGMPPARLGLIYSHTGLARFLRTIGEARTRQLFLLGQYIDADTAAGWGLVTEVVTAEGSVASRALRLAEELASNSPSSIAGNKRIIRSLLTAATLDDNERGALEQLRHDCFSGHDMREGVDAFSEKRRPEWEAR